MESGLSPPLDNCIERGPNLLICWTFSIVGFNLEPAHFAISVNDVNGRMGNTIDLLSFVGWIKQTESVDHLVIRIRQERKVNRAFPVGGNLFSKAPAYFRRIDTDSVEFDVLSLS